MDTPEVIVIGAGISGLSFAWKAAQAGCSVLVLEQRERIGGCFYTHRCDNGFWYEMGAHTVYNSYSSLLDIAIEAGIADRLVRRGPARAHFGLLRNGSITWLTPPKILLKMNWLEAALHAPFGLLRGKKGRSVAGYYSGLLGGGNFHDLFAPFFTAVPSQPADEFPVEGPGSLFKKRPRREEFSRSFGIPGGLQTFCDTVAAHPHIEIRTGVKAVELRTDGGATRIRLQNNDELRASIAAVAVPPNSAADLVESFHPELAAILRRIKTTTVESLGARIARNRCSLPECAFIVPVDDIFYSAVTRDPFPDTVSRGFAFHFKSGISREQKIERLCSILGVSPEDLEDVAEQQVMLPAPRLHHAAMVTEIKKLLDDPGLARLALTGNYFDGLAIEDCVARSFTEWQRLAVNGGV